MFSDLFEFQFMRNAFAAVLLITPLLSLMGTMVVQKRMAYFSDALGHSALTGIAIGVLFGMTDTTVSMIIFGVLFAILLNQIKWQNIASTDTVISVFASASTAVGLAILSRGGTFSQYSAVLVGDILSITQREIIYLVVLLIVTCIFWWVAVNRLVAISIHATLAKSQNIKVKMIEDIFAVLIALVVMLSIKWVGIMLINALLILPAAASRNISENMREYTWYAVLFSVFSGIFGLIVSYYVNIATGPTIVIIAAVIYFATYIYGKNK